VLAGRLPPHLAIIDGDPIDARADETRTVAAATDRPLTMAGELRALIARRSTQLD